MTPVVGTSKRLSAERYLVFMNFSTDRLMWFFFFFKHIIEASKYIWCFKTPREHAKDGKCTLKLNALRRHKPGDCVVSNVPRCIVIVAMNSDYEAV